jgi:hypothetical protein
VTAPAPMIFECEHGSPEWLRARCGIVTASRCVDLLATTKKGTEAAARRNYRAELIAEILTGRAAQHYVTREMEWGIEQEQYARAAYEIHSNIFVETPGFVLHPTVDRFGASPDGLVGDLGLVQIKCPNTSTHLEYMLAGAIPLEHAPQMLAEMACAGRMWNDFVSFDPRLPPHLQLFVKRYYRDDALIAQLEQAVTQFNAEIDAVIAQLPRRGPQAVVAAMDHTDPSELIF